MEGKKRRKIMWWKYVWGKRGREKVLNILEQDKRRRGNGKGKWTDLCKKGLEGRERWETIVTERRDKEDEMGSVRRE